MSKLRLFCTAKKQIYSPFLSEETSKSMTNKHVNLTGANLYVCQIYMFFFDTEVT